MIKTIGNTPAVCLKRIVPPDAAEVWVKIEGVNPTGSYKDRMALAMVEGAEVLVEPSEGGRITPDLWPRMRQRAKDLVGAGDHYWRRFIWHQSSVQAGSLRQLLAIRGSSTSMATFIGRKSLHKQRYWNTKKAAKGKKQA